MLAKLIPLDGSDPIIIEHDLTLVGRSQGFCDLYIDKHSISKLHCLIARTDGLLYIRDLASTNGTRVNGQKVTRGALLPGDELFFAGIGFKVYLGPDEPLINQILDDSFADEELLTADGSDSDVRLIED
ncbi:FHA domain protein [Polystyrenella longa]|uniref:FHA domain protein n=1 Tax=Polystyrenella longa TaxID=2528007 RepID=A0A518CKQ6_9PLAN|nr:FHA domain-containing protein [Polystyrenella longa]QDU79810.1 FHA domain protein [Polystyrenella longa]